MNHHKPRAHPRLLPCTVDELRAKVVKDDFASTVFAKVKADADRILDLPAVQFEMHHGHILNISREVLRRTDSLSVAFLVLGDVKYRDRLWAELETAANFPNWNHGEAFLATAEMAHAFGVAYDLLFDAWSDEQRCLMCTSIVKHALKPALDVYSGSLETWNLPMGTSSTSTRWHKLTHNWNIVSNGGLTVAALAVYDEEAAISEKILLEAKKSIREGLKEYELGSYLEGPGYWGYATKYLTTYFSAMFSALDDDGGLALSPGLAETGYFPIYLNGPTNQKFNYYDAHPEFMGQPAFLWLASRYGHPVMRWWGRQGALNNPVRWDQSSASLWWDGGEQPLNPHEAQLPLDRSFAGSEVVTMRSSWKCSNALFVGFKAGDNSTNHADLDLGTFVLDALGLRWVEDFGPDDYGLPGYWDREEDGQRWTYYTKRAEGHNTIVVNPGRGPDQLVYARGAIVDTDFTGSSAHAVAELSAAHHDIKSWTRSMSLEEDRSQLLLVDDIRLREPSELWWFVHTRADIELDPSRKQARFRLNGQELQVEILTQSEALFQVLPSGPLPSSPNPSEQNIPAEVHKLAIHLKQCAATDLKVRFIPLGSLK